MLVRYFYERGPLEFGRTELDALLESTPALLTCAETVPIVVATIHTVATVPRILDVINRWRREVGDPTPESAYGQGNGLALTPWKEENLWTFRTWTLAMEVSHRFLAQTNTLSEEVFLASLTDLLDPVGREWWKVETIVTTLFTIKKAAWFWPFLV